MAGLVVLGGLGGFVVADITQQPVVEFKEVPVDKEVLVEVPVEVEKIVEKEVTVEVENTDSYDKLEALLAERFEDIFDDAYSVLEQVEAEDKAIDLAKQEIHDKLARELEREDLVDDRDDVDDIDIEEDFEDIEIKKSDFEDEEYKFVFQVEFEDEDKDEEFEALVTVEVEEGEADIKKIELV